MKKFSAIATMALLSTCTAFGQTQLKRDATVYIEANDGYETYLTAALMKEHIPFTFVTQKDQADYVISANIVHHEPSVPSTVINNQASASINVDDGRSHAFEQGWASGEAAAARRAAAKAAMGYSSARLSVLDAKSTQVLFAYTTSKDGSKQYTKTAEDCAKHLKENIEKAEKKK